MPFIDPPEYGEGENPTPKPPPDENFVSPDGLPGCEIVRDECRQHLIYSNYEANAAGIMRRISDGKLVTESVTRPWFIKIRTNRGKLGYYQKSRFVWGGGRGVPLCADEALISRKGDMENCSMMNLDVVKVTENRRIRRLNLV